MNDQRDPADVARDVIREFMDARDEERSRTEKLFEARREMKEKAAALFNVLPPGRYIARAYHAGTWRDVVVTIPLWEDDEPPEIKVDELDDVEDAVKRLQPTTPAESKEAQS